MSQSFLIPVAVLVLTALLTLGACSSTPTDPIVYDGAYVDSLVLVAPDTRAAAFERAGTYTVEVRLTGYQNFTASGVRVTAGTCHVNAVVVPALLLKLRS